MIIKLSLQELNRTTLARQMLLARSESGTLQAIEHLLGLQAQLPSAPYVGLWTRLAGFNHADLSGCINDRRVVKATLMRATLHLFSAGDYLGLRTTLQPALAQASGSITRQFRADFALDPLLEAARDFFGDQPHSFAEFTHYLEERYPGQDPSALRYAVRMYLGLVQVPSPSSKWSFPGNPSFTLVEAWLGQAFEPVDRPQELVRRYLAAFGPASPADMQTWSGLPRLKAVFEQMRSELVVVQDETGRELFDLPGQEYPAADTPAPPRFLPEFDNLLLSHKDRSRVISKQHYASIFLSGLRVSASVLVDGFVRATWQVQKSRDTTVLAVHALEPFSAEARAELEEEGNRLLRFLDPDAKTYDLRMITGGM